MPSETIEYILCVLALKSDAVITLSARLMYKNIEDPADNWTEIIRSTEQRPLQCEVIKGRGMIGSEEGLIWEQWKLSR